MTETRGKAAVAADPQALLDAIRAQVCGSATPGAYPHTLIDQMWDTLTDVQRHGTGQFNGAPSGGPQGTPNGTAEDVLAQLTGSPTPGQITRWGPTTSKSRAGWDGRYRTLAELVAQVAAHAATLTDSGPTTPKVTLTATPAGDGQVRLDWTATAAGTVTGWTASRDGTDTHDTGPWSTPELAAATRTFTMSSLIPGQSYQFTVTGHVTGGKNITGTAAATATGSAPTPAPAPSPTPTPTPSPTPTPTPAPSGSDGTTAAATHGWGTPLPASDEFDYTGAPDPNKWSVYGLGGSVGGAGSNCWVGHAGNGRRCAYTATVGGGFLRQHGYPNGDSAGMASKLGQRYGRWEVRARITSVGSSGNPYHPVLLTWADSDQWPQGGELDFFEVNVGDDRASAYLHHPTQSGVVQDSYQSKPLDLSQWHNYALDWTPTALVGYIDGQEWFRDTDPKAQPPGPMHACIQLDCFFPQTNMQEAYFDAAWVRIYSSG